MRKNLLFFLCLLTLGFSASAAKMTYELCTDRDELLNPDNKFIIVCSKVVKNNLYALKSTETAGSAILTGISTTPESFEIDAEAQGIGLFSFWDDTTSSYYKNLYEHTQNKYWIRNSYGTMHEISSTLSSSSSQNRYEVTIDSAKDSPIVMIKAPATYGGDRYAVFDNGYGDMDFGAWGSTWIEDPDNECYYPYFYKQVKNGAVDPAFIGISPDGYSIEINETLSLQGKFKPEELTYHFTTENDDIVSIDSDKAEFTGLKTGTATIKFTTDATDDYNAGEGEFTITVNKITPDMTFADQVIIGKYPIGTLWEQVILDIPEEERGAITYSSSDDSIITIDARTGQITPDDVKSAGVVTITATMEATDKYAEGHAAYTIVIRDPTEEIKDGNSKFDFSVENPFGMTSTSDDTKYEKKIKEVHVDGITTITFRGDYYSYKNDDGTYDLRVNNDAASEFTISVPEGYQIAAIGMTGSFLYGSYNPSGASKDPDWNTSVGGQQVWQKPNAKVSSVTFTNTQYIVPAKINTIYVQYECIDSNLESADLSFETIVNNILVDEEATINAVINPNDRPITYSIANLSEDEYEITPADNGKINVLVHTPGFYTLEATSPIGDGYRDGYAIMRLNVFRHLDVTVDGEELTEDIIDTEGNKDKSVRFTIPENAKVYYQIIDNDNPTENTSSSNTDKDMEPGFTRYTKAIIIPSGINGKLVFYIANYGYASPKRVIILGEETVDRPEPAESDEFTVQGNSIMAKGTIKLNFKPIAGYDIYFKVTSKSQAPAKVRTKAPCVDAHAGFEKHNGDDIELTKDHASISVFACNPKTGAHSEPATYALDFTTGVAEIELIENGEARYYNLQGIEIANPEKGTYIRVINGKATKIMK